MDNTKTSGNSGGGGGGTDGSSSGGGEVVNINVGVLGHVDSGKTSLVKTLSTLLSTASLDKSVQSRQRGITLDLGFSAFVMPLPESWSGIVSPTASQLQVTLVDCPGHASLIRTIIGGAQIIDMVVLVIDATKGIQTQTAECLVIAEMTTPHLLVVLNKVDLFPPDVREQKIKAMEQKLRGTLSKTTFGRDVPMIPIAACVGGEKTTATTSNNAANTTTKHETYNIEGLLQLLQSQLRPPARFLNNSNSNNSKKGDFYFAVDHCFPIKGQGTVLTGTCLSGSCSVADMVEVPTHQLQRKVKSMQMFRRKITNIHQGDRAGICVANLDPSLMERGILATPGAVTLWKTGAIALVRKVRYFPAPLQNRHANKYHISVGHTTVMATATFFGHAELQHQDTPQLTTTTESSTTESDATTSSSLGGNADLAGLPKLTFDYNQDFLHQDEYINKSHNDTDEDHDSNNNNNNNNDNRSQKSSFYMPLHWCLLEFHTPIYCPAESLIIGSRLDTATNSKSNKEEQQHSTCRLAFSGRLVDKCMDKTRIQWYSKKERVGKVCRLGDPFQRTDDGATVRYEVWGSDLFKKETNMSQFLNMQLETPIEGEIGIIQSSFGTSGKFKVHFPAGTTVKEGDALYLRFKRYVHDTEKKMRQNQHTLPKPRVGTRIHFPNNNSNNGTDPHNPHKKDRRKKNQNNHKKSNETKPAVVVGELASYKNDTKLDNGKYTMVIVSGLFNPEVNIRDYVGTKVRIANEEGSIVGPFGKAGKCKVSFEEIGIDAPIGTKAEMTKNPSSQ